MRKPSTTRSGSEYQLRKQHDKRSTVISLLVLVIVLAGFPALTGFVTLLELSTQVKGILPIANGGTNTSSTLTGIVRGGASFTASEFSGDCTTSGSNVVTCQKINNTTVPTNSAADQFLGTTASGAAAWASIPDCPSGAERYVTATHTWSCATVLTGTLVDNEVPSGTINGATTAFTLAFSPSPAASLLLYKNGMLQRAGGVDYTLSTNTITYGTAPITGDTHVAWYRK